MLARRARRIACDRSGILRKNKQTNIEQERRESRDGATMRGGQRAWGAASRGGQCEWACAKGTRPGAPMGQAGGARGRREKGVVVVDRATRHVSQLSREKDNLRHANGSARPHQPSHGSLLPYSCGFAARSGFQPRASPTAPAHLFSFALILHTATFFFATRFSATTSLTPLAPFAASAHSNHISPICVVAVPTDHANAHGGFVAG